MSFGAMASWQALLLMAGAAGLAAWLFYVKVRPPRINVPSLLLWRRVLDHTREQTWWERVRRAVSLAVTIAIAVALALAVARPMPRLTAASRGRQLIVLDSSWSMRARLTSGETRWERAVAEAKALAQSAGGEDVALATTADGLVEGATSDTALIETALERLVPSGGEGTAWPRLGGTDAVHFFTDGALGRDLDPGVILHSVYEPAANVAITAFAVRPPTSTLERAEAYLEVANYAPMPQEARVTLTRGTVVVLDQPVTMAAGEAIRQVVPLDFAGDPRLRVRVSAPRNALDVDDEAVAWMTSSEPLRVLVVSAEPGALALLLQRDPSLRVTYAKPQAYVAGAEDVVIFDRWLPPTAPSTPALIIAPPATTWVGTVGDEERAPHWMSSAAHPVLAGVDPLTLDLKRAHQFEDKGRMTPVATSERGTTLVAVADTPRARQVVLTFALADSNLAFSPVFPVLVGNTLEWLARPAIAGTGRPGPVEVPMSTTRVIGPEGKAVTIVRAGDRAVVTLPAPGLYRAEAAGAHTVLGVNVGGPELSNLGRTTLDPSVGHAGGERLSGRPWWLYVVGFALVLAAIEWWTWQRRITV